MLFAWGFFKAGVIYAFGCFLPNQICGTHAAGIHAVSRLYLFSLFPVCVPLEFGGELKITLESPFPNRYSFLAEI